MDAKALADALEFAQEELRLCRERRRHYAPGTYSDAMRVMDLDRWGTIERVLRDRVQLRTHLESLLARVLRDRVQLRTHLESLLAIAVGWTGESPEAAALRELQQRLAILMGDAELHRSQRFTIPEELRRG